MEEILLLLREGYNTTLTGMVVAGKSVKVYDMWADSDAVTPYVIIKNMSWVSENTKDSFGGRVFVNLMVHGESKGDFGGRKPTDLVAAEVLKRVIPTPGKSGVQRTGIDVIMARLDDSDDSHNWQTTGRTYSRSLMIEHIVWESKN
jgi:hypothetical protein